MPSKPVKVLIVVPARTFTRDDGSQDTEKGYWVFGKFFANGSTTVILEDDPPGAPFQYFNFETRQIETVRQPGLTVAQKLMQLDEAKGNKTMLLQDGNKVREVKTPPMLEYVNMGEPTREELAAWREQKTAPAAVPATKTPTATASQ